MDAVPAPSGPCCADPMSQKRDMGTRSLGQLGVWEEAALGVLRAYRGGGSFEGPGDGEGGVVPANAALAGGVVEVGSLVEDFGGGGEDEEAVGEAFGDPEEFEFAGFVQGPKVEGGVLAEVGRVAAEVDGDVPDVAGEDADELALGLAELVVEAAEDAARGEGLVVLDEVRGEPGGGEGEGVEDFGEPATIVAEAARIEQLDITQRGLNDLHPTTLARGQRLFLWIESTYHAQARADDSSRMGRTRYLCPTR